VTNAAGKNHKYSYEKLQLDARHAYHTYMANPAIDTHTKHTMLTLAKEKK